MTLWVDGALPFGDGVVDATAAGTPRPTADDLEPVRIAAGRCRGRRVRPGRLKRDVHYTLDPSNDRTTTGWTGRRGIDASALFRLLSDPDRSPGSSRAPGRDYPITPGHYLMLGDNSPCEPRRPCLGPRRQIDPDRPGSRLGRFGPGELGGPRTAPDRQGVLRLLAAPQARSGPTSGWARIFAFLFFRISDISDGYESSSLFPSSAPWAHVVERRSSRRIQARPGRLGKIRLRGRGSRLSRERRTAREIRSFFSTRLLSLAPAARGLTRPKILLDLLLRIHQSPGTDGYPSGPGRNDAGSRRAS